MDSARLRRPRSFTFADPDIDWSRVVGTAAPEGANRERMYNLVAAFQKGGDDVIT